MTRAFVGLGSNVEPRRHLRAALQALRHKYPDLCRSSVYRNAAVGWDGEDFLNLAAAFDCGLPPAALAGELRAIEATLGRRRPAGRRYEPRTLDLDLLMYGDAVIDEPGMRLPRGEVLEQAFVLGPLVEIAGEQVHPLTGRRLSEHWAEFDQSAHPLEPVEL